MKLINIENKNFYNLKCTEWKLRCQKAVLRHNSRQKHPRHGWECWAQPEQRTGSYDALQQKASHTETKQN